MPTANNPDSLADHPPNVSTLSENDRAVVEIPNVLTDCARRSMANKRMVITIPSRMHGCAPLPGSEGRGAVC